MRKLYLTYFPELWSDRIEIIAPVTVGFGVGWLVLCASLPLSKRNLLDPDAALLWCLAAVGGLVFVWNIVPSRISVPERYGDRRPIAEAISGCLLACFLILLLAAALIGEAVLAGRLRALQSMEECLKEDNHIQRGIRHLREARNPEEAKPGDAVIRAEIMALSAVAERYGNKRFARELGAEVDEVVAAQQEIFAAHGTWYRISEKSQERLVRLHSGAFSIQAKLRILLKAHNIDKEGKLLYKDRTFMRYLLLAGVCAGTLICIFRTLMGVLVVGFVAMVITFLTYLMMSPPIGTAACLTFLAAAFGLRKLRRISFMILALALEPEFIIVLTCLSGVFALLYLDVSLAQDIGAGTLLVCAPFVREFMLARAARPGK